MSEAVLDEWQSDLQQKKSKLEERKKKKELQSCLKCDQFLHCEIRDTYVKAVYESMSKGQSGGFEF